MSTRASPSPVHYAAQGRLYRAIVSLPERLCPPDEPLHERIVFFDGPRTPDCAGAYLESLLFQAWGVGTANWCEDGLIYNIQSAQDLIEQNESEDLDCRLFEMSWGGPEGVGYAHPNRVDIFAAPVLKARLQAALDRAVQASVARSAAAALCPIGMFKAVAT